MTTMTQKLNRAEKTQLDKLERTIEQGRAAFVDVGRALMVIRDKKLYCESHATFEDYCRDRWDLGRSYAYNMIDAASVVSAIADKALPTPANEAQARELVPVLKKEPDKLVETWQEVLKSADGKVTAAAIRETVKSTKRRTGDDKQDRKPAKRAKPDQSASAKTETQKAADDTNQRETDQREAQEATPEVRFKECMSFLDAAVHSLRDALRPALSPVLTDEHRVNLLDMLKLADGACADIENALNESASEP